jgi:threonine/homoserine/homoserine lactone efflux protein
VPGRSRLFSGEYNGPLGAHQTLASMSLPVWGFVAVTAPLVLSPGATTAVVLRNSIAGGPRAGVFTAIGANSASICYGLLTAFGFAAALQRWPSVWLLLRWGGVVYLAWLGAGALAAAARARRQSVVTGAPEHDAWHSLTSGYLTNLLNPSLTAFYVIVVPQFIPRDDPFAPSALALTAIHVSMAFSWHLAWAVAGGTLARVLSHRRPRQVLDVVTGVALLVLAAKLAGAF